MQRGCWPALLVRQCSSNRASELLGSTDGEGGGGKRGGGGGGGGKRGGGGGWGGWLRLEWRWGLRL